MLNSRRVCGVIAFALAGIILIGIKDLQFISNGVPGPGLVPYLLVGLMAACGVLLMVGSDAAEDSSDGDSSGVNRRVVGAVGAMGLYVVFMPILGFALVNLLFIFALNWWLGSQRWQPALVFSSIATGVTFLIFSTLLDMPLPMGFWPGLW